MYCSTIGQFLQRDPLPEDGAPVVGYSDRAVASLMANWRERGWSGTHNKYEYAASDPVDHIDPLGLKEEKTCRIILFAGHFLPGNQVDEVDGMLRDLNSKYRDGLPCGWSVGGVGCFPRKIQDNVKDIFGDDHIIPNMPPDGLVKDGFLSFENGPLMLAYAFGKAKDHVKKTCEKECCDKVVIRVNCTKDFATVVANSKNEKQRVLCDNKERGVNTRFQNTFDCKK